MSKKDNTITSSAGNEIYTDDMFIYADEYIDTLRDKEIIYNANGNTFTGMIKYIHRKMKFTKDIYSDLLLLNNIWDIYTELVYKYNQKPTIQEFALLLGCNRDTIYSWMNGEKRAEFDERVGSSRADTVKKWVNECKIGRYKSAASGNVGGIFLCKAVDGMIETAPVQIHAETQSKTVEQIAQDYGKPQVLEDKNTAEQPPIDF